MDKLTPSLKLFSSVSRAPGAVWTEATKPKAPEYLAAHRREWRL